MDKPAEKWVYAKIRAGLGNRMFMLAAGYIVHKMNDLPLHINYVNDNPHSKQHYVNSLFKYFPINLTQPLNLHEAILIQQPDKCFASWNPKTTNIKCKLEGFFQYYPVLIPYENDLRNLFLKGLEEEKEILVSKYNFENMGFIHIRRGDYLKLNHYIIQPVDYYKRAVEIIKNSNPNIRFFVVSDDNNWIKSEDFFKNEIFQIFEGNELETLALMSLSSFAAVCANSTFSWWGAFLGAYEKRNPVIVPKNFIKMPLCENIIPKEWIKI